MNVWKTPSSEKALVGVIKCILRSFIRKCNRARMITRIIINSKRIESAMASYDFFV